MTIQHSLDTLQAWTIGLRTAMGYPDAPIGSPVNFASGRRRNPIEALQVADVVSDTGRDVVYVEFDTPIANGPIGVSLATRATHWVDWHPQVRLYAASDEAPIELLTDTHRWSIGPRASLIASPLPPRSRIARGMARADRLWREAAEKAWGIKLVGSIHVPDGARYADGVPMEEFAATL
ncbi:hypothetical protein ACNFJ7_02815 [Sphingomonas sp. HT-1]|uniref:hypothetical protein n=1 Tax=unclassified Sphingomonas TaxID=196159 RepID=UPI0002E3D47A|nr:MULTISPECIES: hypothetical protein [unclassified Sphingomonas]KTF68989.1 hypothetical protein ATB93_11020 [Sphingomonas sp. WG]